MHDSTGLFSRARDFVRNTRAIARAAALLIVVSFAVVGIAGPSSAHHNTITGSVACKQGGGWLVTWRVVNSEKISETITASNRSTAVPVGTVLTASQSRLFTETITTRPVSTVTLTLSTRWTNNVKKTNSGSIAASSFAVDCAIKEVPAPTISVVDACGPDNAVYGTVPEGPWTSVVNPDRSLTLTANPGYTFPSGQVTITYPTPTDSNTPCVVVTPPVVTPPVVTPPVVTPPVVTPPVVTPPVVTPPEVLPAEVRVVRARTRHIDKCGQSSDLFKVMRSQGVVYRANGKTVRANTWLRAKKNHVTIRAFAKDDSFLLQGKSVWKFRFTNKACVQAPEVAPLTGV